MTTSIDSLQRIHPAIGVARAAAVVLVGAALVGALTSYGQTVLPDWLRSLCNSSGGWSMFAFLLVWASRARPVVGAVLGIVAFEVMLESYGIVSAWRGFFYADPFANSYTLPGIIAGAILGAGAAFVRHRRGRWLVVGVVPLSVVLIGEGAYGNAVLTGSTSPVYWTLEIVLGLVFLVLAVRAARRT